MGDRVTVRDVNKKKWSLKGTILSAHESIASVAQIYLELTFIFNYDELSDAFRATLLYHYQFKWTISAHIITLKHISLLDGLIIEAVAFTL